MIKHIIIYLILLLLLLQCRSFKSKKNDNTEKTDLVEHTVPQPKKEIKDCNKPVVLPPGIKVYFKSLLVIDSTEFYVGANDGYLLHFKNNLFQLERVSADGLLVGNIKKMFLDSTGTILVHADNKVWKKNCELLIPLDTNFHIRAEKFIKDGDSNFYIINRKEIFEYTKKGWQKKKRPLTNHQYEYYGSLGDTKLLAVMTEKLGNVRCATSEICLFKDSCWKAYKSAPFYSVDCFFGNPEINDIYATGWRFRSIPDTLNNSHFMQFVEPIFYLSGIEWVNLEGDDYSVGDIIFVDYKKEKRFDIFKSDGDVYSFNKGQWDTVYIHNIPTTLSSRKKCASQFGSKLLAVSEYQISIYDGCWKVFFDVKELYDKLPK